MRTSISLIFIYIIICVVGTVTGATLYMMYKDVTFLVAGQPLTFFSAPLFVRGIFFIFPLICSLTALFLILYLIRHPVKIVLPIIFYVIIGLFSWCLIIPLFISHFDQHTLSVKNTETLITPGFFREDNGSIYYYSRINQNGTADGLYIDIQGFSGKQDSIIRIDNVQVNRDTSSPYTDLLIRNTMILPRIVQIPISAYKTLYRSAFYAYTGGYFSWLSFASLGIALLSIITLRKLSDWRLINACLAVTVFFGIAFINSICYGNGALVIYSDLLKKWWESKVYSLFSFASFITQPFVVFLNIGIAILLVTVGFISFILKKQRISTDGNGALS